MSLLPPQRFVSLSLVLFEELGAGRFSELPRRLEPATTVAPGAYDEAVYHLLETSHIYDHLLIACVNPSAFQLHVLTVPLVAQLENYMVQPRHRPVRYIGRGIIRSFENLQYGSPLSRELLTRPRCCYLKAALSDAQVDRLDNA